MGAMGAMRAMRLHGPGQALRGEELPAGRPGPGQVRLAVQACGVCRTDLHVVDGDLAIPSCPVTPGHEVVGTLLESGPGADLWPLGARLGVPWLGWTCGECGWCRGGRENLCPAARFTGLHLPGGFAGEIVADARFCFPLPPGLDAVEAAPLLCAGLIGHRALRMAPDADRIGLYGFGAAAHLIAQVARWEGRRVFAFTRPGDVEAQALARELGAEWAGGSSEAPPEPLAAALLFAPVGELVPLALRAVEPGGTVVCAGIHMTEIPAFPYELLWGERTVRSVANLTREDGHAFLALASRIPLRTRTTRYPLAAANRALDDLRAGRLVGAAVLVTEA